MTSECILEKIYHSSGSPSLSSPLRRERELFWIKELGTAKPYGFNDQIKGVGTLSSTSCKKTNVYTLFNKHQRRKRSHGKRHYNKKAPQPESSIDVLITLIDMIDQPEGVHKIKTHLFSTSIFSIHQENSCKSCLPSNLIILTDFHSFTGNEDKLLKLVKLQDSC